MPRRGWPGCGRPAGWSRTSGEADPRKAGPGWGGRAMTEIAIADHGLVGDLQTAALISADGSVDWFCCPRFDSPSVFGALLDPGGGHFWIRPATSGYRARQMYLPDTAVLITRFLSEAGVSELIDFMPPTGHGVTDNHRLVRMLRCVRGEMSFAIDLAPR